MSMYLEKSIELSKYISHAIIITYYSQKKAKCVDVLANSPWIIYNQEEMRIEEFHDKDGSSVIYYSDTQQFVIQK